MSRRALVIAVISALTICAVALAQQRHGTQSNDFGSIEVERAQSTIVRTQKVLAVPWHINYQGYLTDDTGVPIDDTLSMSFGIWDDPSAGTELWNEGQSVVVEQGLFNVVLGSVTPIPSGVFQAGASRWLELTVEAQALSPRTEVTSVGYAYRAVISDSADILDGFNASASPTANDLFPLTVGDAQYVNEGQADAVTSSMIVDGQVGSTDLGTDAVTTGKIFNLAVTSEKIAADAVISGKVLDGSLIRDDVADTFKAPYADTADYAHAAPASPDNDWTMMGNVLYANGNMGLSMRSYNVLYGIYDSSHVNLGIQCTTGTSGEDRAFITVSGGFGNTARQDYGAVGGGSLNDAGGYHNVIGGGENNSTNGQYATVAGGRDNTAGVDGATVTGGGMNSVVGGWAWLGGGWANQAAGYQSVVGGGYGDTVNGDYGAVLSGYSNMAGDAVTDTAAAIAAGLGNDAFGRYSFVGGGYFNTAAGDYATVGGGNSNSANAIWATIPGGYANTCDAADGFAATSSSTVLAGHSSSAAFNGQTSTSSAETRVGTISKVAGTFTIDHPLDPENKILNHYFVESPEMVLIYRGSATIGADGKAEVRLPAYFDALNQSPMVQLTGVGTYEVFVAEKVEGNRFVIGGKPGTEVYWTVTGDRKDQPAEIARTLKPVEQPKVGGLAARSLDDEYLSATMMQLESMGQASRFSFRTSAGRARYEETKRRLGVRR
jgi:hypothetical protein